MLFRRHTARYRARIRGLALGTLLLGVAQPGAGAAQTPTSPTVPLPASFLGFEPGASGRAASWDDLHRYYERVAERSRRVSLDTLGRSTEGRELILLTITSEENHGRLDELRTAQEALADPRKISGTQELMRTLDRGRTVVLMTHGVHPTEVGSVLAAPGIVHRLATSPDPEIREILDHVILLVIPSLNPDGTQAVAEWVDRWRGTQWAGSPFPGLAHPYVGHDANRDWYAFTQAETEIVVREVLVPWRPHIVHDLHQMGARGPRLFLPPYVDPIDPNVDPTIVASVARLGTAASAALTARGLRGVVVNALYDAWSPGRAFVHYHGGVRILSETASARMAEPIRISQAELLPVPGFQPDGATWNHPAPWSGGEWGLTEILTYMEATSFAVLLEAARSRRSWLEHFHATRIRGMEPPRGAPHGWLLEDGATPGAVGAMARVLALAGVEVRRTRGPLRVGTRTVPAGALVVPAAQPSAPFARTLLEPVSYPRGSGSMGGSLTPYDATAHELPLLMGGRAVPLFQPLQLSLSAPITPPEAAFRLPPGVPGPGEGLRVALYTGPRPGMAGGWTRWLLDQHGLPYDTVGSSALQESDLGDRWDVILFQSQPPQEILAGWSAGEMPPGFRGGIGTAGLRNLERFVRGGGRLVAIEAAGPLFVEGFELPVRNVLERLPLPTFSVPGAIVGLVPGEEEGDLQGRAVRLGVSTVPLTGPRIAGLAASPPDVGWFDRDGAAYEPLDPSVRVLLRYAPGDPVRAGAGVGSRLLGAQGALVHVPMDRGEVILFGFQPNYRGQSRVTWPLLLRTLYARPNDMPTQVD